MKVHELISRLNTLDPELEVLVSGYEGGYSGVRGVTEPQEYVQDVNDAWYYGPHEPLWSQLSFEHLTLEQAQQKGIFKGITIF